MLAGLTIDLKSVTTFNLVQADGPLEYNRTIVDEKPFTELDDAIKAIQESQAPVKYLYFYHGGSLYKLFPIEDTEEFTVQRTPAVH